MSKTTITIAAFAVKHGYPDKLIRSYIKKGLLPVHGIKHVLIEEAEALLELKAIAMRNMEERADQNKGGEPRYRGKGTDVLKRRSKQC